MHRSIYSVLLFTSLIMRGLSRTIDLCLVAAQRGPKDFLAVMLLNWDCEFVQSETPNGFCFPLA